MKSQLRGRECSLCTCARDHLCCSVCLSLPCSPFSSQRPPRSFISSEPPATGSAGVWKPGLSGGGGSCQGAALTQVTAKITAPKAELCSHHPMVEWQQQPKSDGDDNIWWLLCAVRAGRGNCPFRRGFVNRYMGNAHHGV